MQQVGYRFEVLAVDIDESPLPSEDPFTYVARMAKSKAAQASALLRDSKTGEKAANLSVLLASDTSVVLGDRVFGKPENYDNFVRMMGELSGRSHEVMTSVCVCSVGLSSKDEEVIQYSDVITTKVFFKLLTEFEIEAYWQTQEPVDKAGGYAIQGRGALFVERIEGSYSNVVGLPLQQTAALLAKFQISPWS